MISVQSKEEFCLRHKRLIKAILHEPLIRFQWIDNKKMMEVVELARSEYVYSYNTGGFDIVFSIRRTAQKMKQFN